MTRADLLVISSFLVLLLVLLALVLSGVVPVHP